MSADLLDCLESLPFVVQYRGHMWPIGVDGAFDVEIRFASGEEGAFGAIEDAFARFASLAKTGALAGEAIDPVTSGLAIEAIAPHYDGSLSIRITQCQVDPNSILVLLNLLVAHQRVARISRIKLGASGGLAEERRWTRAETEFPGVFRALPFRLTDDAPESGAYSFTATFATAVRNRNVRELGCALQRWVQAVLAGGYEMPSISPQSSYVEPSTAGLVVFDNRIEWAIFKLRADPAAVHGIINIFASFHRRTQPLVSLEIL